MHKHRLSAGIVSVWACLRATMAHFKYDLIAMFELIAARPCVWNRRSEEYKCKSARDEGWQEVFRALDDTYENQSIQEKKKNGDIIIQKWTNIRDAFIRSLKVKSAKRKYLYADHLEFLLLTQESTCMDTNITELSDIKQEYFVEEDESSISNIETSDSPQPCPRKTTLRNEFEFEFTETELKRPRLVSESNTRLQEEAALSTSKDDETFFSSFMPYIRNFTEDERLDLHVEIITAIQRIRSKRRLKTDFVGSNWGLSSTSTSNV